MPVLLLMSLVLIFSVICFLSLYDDEIKVFKCTLPPLLIMILWLVIGSNCEFDEYESKTYPILKNNNIQYSIVDNKFINITERMKVVAEPSQILQVSNPKSYWKCGIYWGGLIFIKYKLVEKFKTEL